MIRKIKREDISLVNELGKKYDNNFLNHYNLLNYLSDNIYEIFVYIDSNIIKGFIISTKMFETVEILFIFVDEPYRKFGIATALINKVSTLNGTKNVFLEVSKLNLPAYYLYKKVGFELISIRKGYYSGVDAYVMKKVIE